MNTKINNAAPLGRVSRLVRGAWWLAWVPLFVLAALYVGLHVPCAMLIMAIKDDCAASRWLHDSTDWALDSIWKICPANVKVLASAAQEPESKEEAERRLPGTTCWLSSSSVEVRADDQGEYYIHPMTGERVNKPATGWKSRGKVEFRPLEPSNNQQPSDPNRHL